MLCCLPAWTASHALWADCRGKGLSKGSAAFPQGHRESLARGWTYLQSLRNILKLSRLGTQPWFVLSFHRLDLNVSRFSFIGSPALLGWSPRSGVRVRGGTGALLAPQPSSNWPGRRVLGNQPKCSLGPGSSTGRDTDRAAWMATPWRSLQWEHRPSTPTRCHGPEFQEPTQWSVQGNLVPCVRSITRDLPPRQIWISQTNFLIGIKKKGCIFRLINLAYHTKLFFFCF